MADALTFHGTYFGFRTHVDFRLGHLWVMHDGTVTWDQMQSIKNLVWGDDARAIEVYPAEKDVVNTVNCRHLWRLGETDFAPDLLGHTPDADSLETRHANAWAEANGVG